MAKTAKNTTLNPFVGSTGNVVPLVSVATTLAKKLKITSKQFEKSAFNKFTWLDPNEIYVNFGAQRWPDDAQIGKVSSKFNPYKLSLIHI